MTGTSRYYVYELIDPRDRSVFYVGKGQRNRRHQHLLQALSGKHSRKCEKIREIVAAGLEHEAPIIATFDNEQDALDAEARRIAEIGLSNLTNVFPNGRAFVFGGKRPKLSKPLTASQYQTIVKKNAFRIAVAEALMERGYRFMFGDLDINDILRTAFQSLRRKAAA